MTIIAIISVIFNILLAFSFVYCNWVRTELQWRPTNKNDACKLPTRDIYNSSHNLFFSLSRNMTERTGIVVRRHSKALKETVSKVIRNVRLLRVFLLSDNPTHFKYWVVHLALCSTRETQKALRREDIDFLVKCQPFRFLGPSKQKGSDGKYIYNDVQTELIENVKLLQNKENELERELRSKGWGRLIARKLPRHVYNHVKTNYSLLDLCVYKSLL